MSSAITKTAPTLSNLLPNAVPILAAIADTFIPTFDAVQTQSLLSLRATQQTEGHDPAWLTNSELKLLASSRAEDMNTAHDIASALSTYGARDVVKTFSVILWLLSSRYGTWMLCGGVFMVYDIKV